MLNQEGEVFTGIVRKVKHTGTTPSGMPRYRIVLDNRTIDTKPDGAVNFFAPYITLNNEYVFVLENGVVVDYRQMPSAPTGTTTKE